jgi:hypothetical protein
MLPDERSPHHRCRPGTLALGFEGEACQYGSTTALVVQCNSCRGLDLDGAVSERAGGWRLHQRQPVWASRRCYTTLLEPRFSSVFAAERGHQYEGCDVPLRYRRRASVLLVLGMTSQFRHDDLLTSSLASNSTTLGITRNLVRVR